MPRILAIKNLSLAVLLVPLSLWLMRRAPRAWPHMLGGALTALILAVGWLPYALASGRSLPSLPQGPLRTALAPLIRQAQLPAPDILADASPGSLTDVTGGLAPTRVVIGDDIIISVVEIRDGKVRLGVVVPKECRVHRKEVHDAIHGLNPLDTAEMGSRRGLSGAP